jgi:hypothetical protein
MAWGGPPYTIQPRDFGQLVYFVLLDSLGYPRAQGSRALCEEAKEKLNAEESDAHEPEGGCP